MCPVATLMYTFIPFTSQMNELLVLLRLITLTYFVQAFAFECLYNLPSVTGLDVSSSSAFTSSFISISASVTASSSSSPLVSVSQKPVDWKCISLNYFIRKWHLVPGFEDRSNCILSNELFQLDVKKKKNEITGNNPRKWIFKNPMKEKRYVWRFDVELELFIWQCSEDTVWCLSGRLLEIVVLQEFFKQIRALSSYKWVRVRKRRSGHDDLIWTVIYLPIFLPLSSLASLKPIVGDIMLSALS